MMTSFNEAVIPAEAGIRWFTAIARKRLSVADYKSAGEIKQYEVCGEGDAECSSSRYDEATMAAAANTRPFLRRTSAAICPLRFSSCPS
jgi:hypothetical protein